MMDVPNVVRRGVPLCLLAFLLAPAAGVPQATDDPAALVDPFVGTALSVVNDHGYTTPGAVRPFGMIYWGPDTTDIINYHYDDPVTYGFSLTHISGPGCGLYGDAPIFPMVGIPEKTPVEAPTAYQSGFSHTAEVAEPGFYSVTLDSGIKVRIAVDVHAGISEFTFPAGAAPHTLLLNLGHNLGGKDTVADADIKIDGRRITGSVSSSGLCGRKILYRVYFVLELSEAPQSFGTFDQAKIQAGSRTAAGARVGGYVCFPASMLTVGVKAAISFVSVANAERNLRTEVGGRGINRLRGEARAAWNSALGRVQVTGGTDEDRKIFYTALYHAFLHPSVFNDVNGDYLGFDGKVHQAQGRTHYANFSGWDIYRSEVQLLAMLFPERAGDMAQSLVVDAEQGGGLPVWTAGNFETGAMAGDPGACIIAAMYAFGVRGFDTQRALAAMLRGANDPATHSQSRPERPYLDEYLHQGYISQQKQRYGTASIALEYENADFAVSRFAAALGDEASARALEARSAQWRKLWDPETRYIRPRLADGSFLPDFSISAETGFIEGNAAQYTWMIPFDLAGVIEAIGGPAAANARLDNYFSQYYDWTKKNGPYVFISNEPSFGNPWVYNWTGEPWRTQEVVRKAIRDLFADRPGGLPGNDDLGAMSSWLVFADLGMYPEIPGVGGVTLNSPIFPEVTLQLGEHKLRITGAGAPSQLYVQSVKLDGQPVRNWWIDWEQLSRASHLEFTLGAEPNHEAGQAPPSFGDKASNR